MEVGLGEGVGAAMVGEVEEVSLDEVSAVFSAQASTSIPR